jgi:MFS family permease
MLRTNRASSDPVKSLVLGPGVQVTWFAISRFGAMAGFAIYSVAQLSYRQAICPPELMGRMNASLRFVVFGVSPLGSLAGGAIAASSGNRLVLVLVAVCSLAGPLWLLISSLHITDESSLRGTEELSVPARES